MSYSESHTDRNIRTWFQNDNTCGLLREIRLAEGHLRGLESFRIDLNYPISAIAGKNGCGKSTLLALAACAYHNSSDGFKLSQRVLPYYRFSDFFIQHRDELSPEGVEVLYRIAHDNWRVSEYAPNGVGLLYQSRKKKKGGRWTNYDRRVPRDVAFLGIERIVPHNEKSQSKSYYKAFESSIEEGWEERVKDAVGRVLGKSYEEFRFVSHSKYRLPIVKSSGNVYSGFNMGAGENALFEMFSVLYSIGQGGLVIIDEIELGLHAEAQKKFIGEIKEICKKRKVQVICTTHSRNIFDSLPLDARFFLESKNGASVLTPEITSDFAFSKLSNQNSGELTIMVEDNVAEQILKSSLPSSFRKRVQIEKIGSVNALLKQLAANHERKKSRENLVIVLDGDQDTRISDNLAYFSKSVEGDIEDGFFEDRVLYLPGSTWPEKILLEYSRKSSAGLANLMNADEPDLICALDEGALAGKHKEVYTIAQSLGLSEEEVLTKLCINLYQSHADILNPLLESLNNRVCK